MGPRTWGRRLSVVLLFAATACSDPAPPPASHVEVLQVSGMTCESCAEAIRAELQRIHGVETVEVDVEEGRVRVTGTGIQRTLLADAVQSLGYDVTGGGPEPGETMGPSGADGPGRSPKEQGGPS